MSARALGVGTAMALAIVALLTASADPPTATFNDTFVPSRDHRALQYTTRLTGDAVRQLNERLLSGKVRFNFDPESGYLNDVLAALGVPVESQVAVFSKTSLQASR